MACDTQAQFHGMDGGIWNCSRSCHPWWHGLGRGGIFHPTVSSGWGTVSLWDCGLAEPRRNRRLTNWLLVLCLHFPPCIFNPWKNWAEGLGSHHTYLFAPSLTWGATVLISGRVGFLSEMVLWPGRGLGLASLTLWQTEIAGKPPQHIWWCKTEAFCGPVYIYF